MKNQPLARKILPEVQLLSLVKNPLTEPIVTHAWSGTNEKDEMDSAAKWFESKVELQVEVGRLNPPLSLETIIISSFLCNSRN